MQEHQPTRMAWIGRFTLMLACGLFSFAAAGTVSHGLAAGSGWHESSYNRVRLVSGGDVGQARLAGIQIRLDPGWKTYWRMPGDAGVPPLADWSASVNVAQVDMQWPAPTRYVDPWATTIGYVGEVVFPVLVTPADPALPVSLRLTLTYAVCSDICVPVEAGLALDLLPGDPGPDRALIDSYREMVPHAGALADAGIAAVMVEGEGEDTRLVVDIVPSAPGVEPDIFVEGPDAFYFGTPETTTAADGRLRLAIPVDGVKADRPLAGASLKLTVVNGERRVEHELSVN